MHFYRGPPLRPRDCGGARATTCARAGEVSLDLNTHHVTAANSSGATEAGIEAGLEAVRFTVYFAQGHDPGQPRRQLAEIASKKMVFWT